MSNYALLSLAHAHCQTVFKWEQRKVNNCEDGVGKGFQQIAICDYVSGLNGFSLLHTMNTCASFVGVMFN
jgi:hypothetical protein